LRRLGTRADLDGGGQGAIALLERGMSLKEVARRVGASFSAVFRWQQAVVQDGPGALKAKPVPGRPRKLPEGERQRLLDLLLEGKSSAPCNAWGPGADVKIGKLAQASFRCYVLIHALGESSGEVHAGAGRSGATRPTDRGPGATALRAGP